MKAPCHVAGLLAQARYDVPGEGPAFLRCIRNAESGKQAGHIGDRKVPLSGTAKVKGENGGLHRLGERSDIKQLIALMKACHIQHKCIGRSTLP